ELIIFVISPPPTRSTLFPYTTLFRSIMVIQIGGDFFISPSIYHIPIKNKSNNFRFMFINLKFLCRCRRITKHPSAVKKALFRTRSEEHTSELQSRENLVCRLLLEKKK